MTDPPALTKSDHASSPELAEPVLLPPRRMWRFGRCACCDRQTLVAPGPQIPTDHGELVTLPYCLDGFARANRYVHRVRMRARLGQREGAA